MNKYKSLYKSLCRDFDIINALHKGKNTLQPVHEALNHLEIPKKYRVNALRGCIDKLENAIREDTRKVLF